MQVGLSTLMIPKNTFLLLCLLVNMNLMLYVIHLEKDQKNSVRYSDEYLHGLCTGSA